MLFDQVFYLNKQKNVQLYRKCSSWLCICNFLTSHSLALIPLQAQVEFFLVIFTRHTVTKPVVWSSIRAQDKLFRCIRGDPLCVVNSENREKRTLHKCGGS